MISRADRIDQIAGVAARSGFLKLAPLLNERVRPDAARVLNYHHVLESEIGAFRDQIAWIVERYSVLGLDEFRALVNDELQLTKPPVVLTFDDGLLSQARGVVATLDDFEIPGWFFIPTDAPVVEVDAQFAWATDHGINPAGYGFSEGEHIFASWDDWRSVGAHHVLGSHTATHRRFTADVNEATVREELVRSQQTLRGETARDDMIFCWVGGEFDSYSATAVSVMRELQYEFVFTTNSRRFASSDDPHRIERTNVESRFSWDRFQLAMSGAIDWRYASKRRQLAKLYQQGVA